MTNVLTVLLRPGKTVRRMRELEEENHNGADALIRAEQTRDDAVLTLAKVQKDAHGLVSERIRNAYDLGYEDGYTDQHRPHKLDATLTSFTGRIQRFGGGMMGCAGD